MFQGSILICVLYKVPYVLPKEYLLAHRVRRCGKPGAALSNFPLTNVLIQQQIRRLASYRLTLCCPG